MNKFTGNKPISVAVKIAIVLTVDIVLNRIIPNEFLQFDHRGYFDKMFNNQPLSLVECFYMIWNRDIRLFVIYLFIIVIVIRVLYRYRFNREDNFQLSKHTAVVASICFIPAIIGYAYMMHYQYQHGVLYLESQLIYFFRQLYIVGLFEELVYRGYIANELFKLKDSGLKTPVAIVISAVLFWFSHIQGAVVSALFFGMPFSIMQWGFWEQFLSVAFFGAAMAVILFYRKDIVSLICIHAAHNILLDSYIGSSQSILMGALYGVFYTVAVVCYPAILIYKARKRRSVYN